MGSSIGLPVGAVATLKIALHVLGDVLSMGDALGEPVPCLHSGWLKGDILRGDWAFVGHLLREGLQIKNAVFVDVQLLVYVTGTPPFVRCYNEHAFYNAR